MAAVPKWDDTTEIAPAAHAVPKWEDTVEHVPQAKPSELESLARGALQGGTLGFADEAYGGAKALYDAAKKGSFDDFAKVYADERDSVRAANKKAEEANPKSYLGGNVAGSLATAIVPGLNIAKGASLGARAALAGAGGAVAGLGNSEADLTKGDVGGAARDTAIGGALGAGLQVGGETLVAPAISAIGDAVSPLTQKVSNFIGNKAKQASGYIGDKAAGLAERAADVSGNGTGRELLDRGVVRFGDNTKNIASRANEMLDSGAENASNIVAGLDDAGAGVHRNNILNRITDRVYELKDDPAQAALVKKLHRAADAVESGAPRQSLSEAQATASSFKGNPAGEIYSEAVDAAAKRASPDAASALQDIAAERQVLQPVKQAAAKSRVGSYDPYADALAIGVGAATGDDYRDRSARGLLFAGARRTLAPRLAASGAVGLDKIAKALMGNPSALGKYAAPLAQAAARGNKSLAATQYILQQRDPEFSAMKKKLEDAGE